jgi:hypothetical protein
LDLLVRHHIKTLGSNGLFVNRFDEAERLSAGPVSIMVGADADAYGSELLISAEWFSLSRQEILNTKRNQPFWERRLLLAASGPEAIRKPPLFENAAFKVSDLFIGALRSETKVEDFPVVPLKKNILGAHDTVWVYFEVAETPVPAYQVEVSVVKKRGAKATTAITLNYQRRERVSREYFELPLNRLSKGNWTVTMTFRSGPHRVTRTETLEINY